MAHNKKRFGNPRTLPKGPKKGPPLGLVIALSTAFGIVIGWAGTLYLSKPAPSPAPVAAATAQGQPGGGMVQPAFTPGPQPPGPVPPGKVWSVEHGHWHDAPGAATTTAATGSGNPVSVTVTPPGTPAPAPVPNIPFVTPAPPPDNK